MPTYYLRTPIQEGDIRKLRVGDIVYLSGIVVTARDAAHKRLVDYLREGKSPPIDLKGGAIYHCGPVVKRVGEEWKIISAGPTTSTRMELYEAEVIQHFGVRFVIGKGGMGSRTAWACREFGAVYAIFTGGAGVLAADTVKRVVKVEWLDLGIPEALWVFEVENFGPLIIAIDTTGRNLLQEVLAQAIRKREEVLKKLNAI